MKTKRRAYRLTKEHRSTASLLYWSFDAELDSSAPSSLYNYVLTPSRVDVGVIKGWLTRIYKLAGVTPQPRASVRSTFELAMRAIYRKSDEENGFNPDKAYRCAENIYKRLSDY